MVYAVYFSGTGTTAKVVKTVASQIDSNYIEVDFTRPNCRLKPLEFSREDIVIFGMPVIAGRVPNLMVPFLSTIKGNGALAVAISVYGNRNYDNSLIELVDILEEGGLRPIGAAAFIGQHSFSQILAKGRPDQQDLKICREFGDKIKEKINKGHNLEETIKVKGTPKPYGGYYMPQDREGNHIDIRKVKPKTLNTCNKCMICVDLCPMGAIDREDPTKVTGICMKCCGCEKKCPQGAKYFDDPGYLFHKRELEAMYFNRKEPEIYY